MNQDVINKYSSLLLSFLQNGLKKNEFLKAKFLIYYLQNFDLTPEKIDEINQYILSL